MPQVYNKHHSNVPLDAVYIGRGSPWGNPFTVEEYGRAQAIELYASALSERDLQLIRDGLKGRDLVCFCKPAACHGDILLRIANEE